MDSSQLGQLEKALRRQKYDSAAEAVHKLAESGKLAYVNLRADTRGNILGLKVGNDVLVSEKDLAVKDKGARITDGNISKLGDTYQIGKTSLNNMIVAGQVQEADKYSKQWFITDPTGKVVGLSKEGLSFAEQSAESIGSYLESSNSDIFTSKIGGSFGIPKLLGISLGTSTYKNFTRQEKINLIKSGIIKNMQEIALKDSYGTTTKEKGRAEAEYLNLVFTSIMKTAKGERVKSLERLDERIKDMQKPTHEQQFELHH